MPQGTRATSTKVLQKSADDARRPVDHGPRGPELPRPAAGCAIARSGKRTPGHMSADDKYTHTHTHTILDAAHLRHASLRRDVTHHHCLATHQNKASFEQCCCCWTLPTK